MIMLTLRLRHCNAVLYTGTLFSPLQVVMIAHIPPGDPGNTLHEYDEFYLNLTKRFHDTIVGHLFGHTHHDEFKLVSLYTSPLNINIFCRISFFHQELT